MRILCLSTLLSLTIITASHAQQIPCDQFRANQDGSWTPVRAMTIRAANGEITVTPAVSFRAGIAFMGIDLGSVLDQNCR